MKDELKDKTIGLLKTENGDCTKNIACTDSVKKSPFAGKLLVCDMDGTLLNSRCEVSPENQAALEYFVRHGGRFTIATGRAETSVKRFYPQLPINTPGIVYNGSAIYDFSENKVLWQSCLSMEVKSTVKALVNTFPELGIEAFYGENIYFLQQNEETEKHRVKEQLLPLTVPIEQIPWPWYKVLLAWNPEYLPKVESFLKEHPGPYRPVYSEPQFLELLPENTSKGHALEELIRRLDCSPSDVVAMGDNQNDIEMLKTAGTGIAVANAHPEVKTAAGVCCCHHDDHAVARVIGWIEKAAVQGVSIHTIAAEEAKAEPGMDSIDSYSFSPHINK